MTSRYDICAGRKDRDGKTFWLKIGAMWPAREGDGFSIKLDAIPLPDEKGDVWVKAFVPKDRDAAPRQASTSASRAPAPIDDDIAF